MTSLAKRKRAQHEIPGLGQRGNAGSSRAKDRSAQAPENTADGDLT